MGIIALITLGFLAAGFVLHAAVDARITHRRIRERAMGVDSPGEQVARADSESRQPRAELFPGIKDALSSRGWATRIMLELERAGLRWRPSEFVGLACALAVVLAFAAALLLPNLFALVVALAVGLGSPVLYMRRLQATRRKTFSLQLPDALSLMSSAIRTGFGLQRAAQLVSDELSPPISEEFARALTETSLHGRDFVESLERMVGRVQSYDLELFVVAVAIQRDVGGDLAEIMENIENTIRSRLRAEGEMAVLTAEGRLSGVILIALPIVLAVLVAAVNPSYLMPLITDPIGRIMLACGVTLQIVGALIIRRILRLDY